MFLASWIFQCYLFLFNLEQPMYGYAKAPSIPGTNYSSTVPSAEAKTPGEKRCRIECDRAKEEDISENSVLPRENSAAFSLPSSSPLPPLSLYVCLSSPPHTRVSVSQCIPGWCQINCIAKNDLGPPASSSRVLRLLYSNYHCLFYVLLSIKPRASCMMLGKYCADRATVPAPRI